MASGQAGSLEKAHFHPCCMASMSQFSRCGCAFKLRVCESGIPKALDRSRGIPAAAAYLLQHGVGGEGAVCVVLCQSLLYLGLLCSLLITDTIVRCFQHAASGHSRGLCSLMHCWHIHDALAAGCCCGPIAHNALNLLFALGLQCGESGAVKVQLAGCLNPAVPQVTSN